MEVTYSKEVSRVLEAEGITHGELLAMVEKAAITSVRGFNRRYHQWLFLVKNGVLLKMEGVEVAGVGFGDDSMEEDCGRCEGSGCGSCQWSGTVRRRVVDTTAAAMTAARAGLQHRPAFR